MSTVHGPRDARGPGPGEVVLLDVFVNGPGGGNPVPLVRHAAGMVSGDMQAVARSHGHESAFVFDSEEEGVDWRFRFFVPKHEMEMCGHATVGALWALRTWGEWTGPTARVRTLSGLVDARWDADREGVWVSQPAATRAALPRPMADRVRRVLDPHGRARWADDAVVNACTSRTKTLVRLQSVAQLDSLEPDLAAVESMCADADSTGLYPYAVDAGAVDGAQIAARQFPRASGYPEDAATGIAAAALWSHLGATGAVPVGTPNAPVTTTVRQGEAMGRPSAIAVQARFDAEGRVTGCWLGGQVRWSTR